ncbi:urease accessory protein UreE [Gluconacetobacter sacchari DSM 12717]|uniref:Urease accessory protein UreE n=2 Tax=Gluconacetobacter sacchari TaxID=92759 RepID=A0A7W4NME0_9PROT|nr:urease accessory protein UreE [Gluconacetobacter sacchari]MBB2160499.1 urease accessory protein UreE [Gluconacetobacter sacchari]GBQ32844.1 urease accessory protein UreE [Gluconacetobacter sacchari DSM 12717]
MAHVTEILPAGSWPVAQATDVFAADCEGRHRRRMMLPLGSGETVLLDLAHARLLRAGEGLKLDDGRIVRVEALPEALMEVTAHGPLHLLRLAWHLGNRHLPAAIDEARILVRRDHVIADMIRGLGGHVRMVEVPFDPESGAYAARGEAAEHGHHHHAHD